MRRDLVARQIAPPLHMILGREEVLAVAFVGGGGHGVFVVAVPGLPSAQHVGEGAGGVEGAAEDLGLCGVVGRPGYERGAISLSM